MIDAHHHLWRLERCDYGWLTPDLTPLYRDFEWADLEPELNDAGVTGTVLVQAAPTPAETDFLLGIAHAQPAVLAVVGWADLASERAPQRIEELAARPKLAGLRPMIQDEPDPEWMLQASLAPGFRAMAECGLRLDALVRPRHLPRLAQLAGRHPELRIVLDHAGKPDIASGAFEPWASDIAKLARRPQVWCKLSGLLTEAHARRGDDDIRPYVDHVLATFGPGRIMWGSDWPVLRLAGDYQDWMAQAQRLAGALTAGERDQLFRRTAVEFYDLEDR